MALDFIYNFGLYLSLFHRYGGGEMQGLSFKSCCHISLLQDRQPHPTALDHGSRLHNQMMGGAWRLEEQEGEKCSGPVWSHSPTYTVWSCLEAVRTTWVNHRPPQTTTNSHFAERPRGVRSRTLRRRPTMSCRYPPYISPVITLVFLLKC